MFNKVVRLVLYTLLVIGTSVHAGNVKRQAVILQEYVLSDATALATPVQIPGFVTLAHKVSSGAVIIKVVLQYQIQKIRKS